MKKLFFAIVMIGLFAYAEESSSIPAEGKSIASRVKQSQMKRFGGMIVRPGSLKGKIVVASSQDLVDEDTINAAVEQYAKIVKVTIEYKKCDKPTCETASKMVSELDANAVLFVLDDPNLPTLLSAPESRWVFVNISSLNKGAGTNPNVFAKRVQKELTRGFALLAGAQGSTYPNGLMGPITSLRELDYVGSVDLPVDVLSRFPVYLKGLGITPAQNVPYREACKEGWAPAPTNEYQQVIWDETHSIPANPIKIKREKK